MARLTLPRRQRASGHAPGHIREAFLALINHEPFDIGFRNATHQQTWAGLTEDQRLRWLCGQLWSCTDCLPGSECSDLGLQQGSTYAEAARVIRPTVVNA